MNLLIGVSVGRRGFRRFVPLLALALPAVAAAQPAVLSPSYEAVVRRYISGDREGAVSDLSAWPEESLRREVTALSAFRKKARACHPCAASMAWQQIPARAALLLHSDCALLARRHGRPPQLHESVAVEIARLLKDDPTQREFPRRWYETMAGLAQGENRWSDALDWAERGLREFSDSVEMLLVVGSLEETLGAQAELRLPESPFDPRPRETRANLLLLREARGHLETAHRSLRSAIAADPSLAEARLRLGRVAWRLGETAEARSALEKVLADKPKPATAFLAHLFLGRLDEDAGRLAEAARAYEAALALDTRSQSARMALSHVSLRLGNAGIARSEMEKAVGFAGRRPEPDAYWLYPWGPSIGAGERLEALRREASS